MVNGSVNSDMTNNRLGNTADAIYFNFSYSALKLLGKNLYNNAANAISELVANGLDARAKNVYVYIDMSDKASSIIEIIDDGVGMNYNDLAEKYVWIGRNKRKDADLLVNEKHNIMGRKGIGKLAALYLTNRYYILTKKQMDLKPTNWEVNLSAYDDSDFPSLHRVLNNVSLVNYDIWQSLSHGTVIKLENVDLRRHGIKRIEGLKRIFADFYLLDSLNTSIYVSVKTDENKTSVFEKIEKNIAFKNFYGLYDNSTYNVKSKILDGIAFTWASTYSHIANKKRNTVILNTQSFPNTAGVKEFTCEDGTKIEKKYELVGWIGIHATIEEKNAVDKRFIRNNVYQPNRLRIYVRNKLAVSNYFDIHPSTQTMSNYIEGEISFDILDDDDLPDIATSNRQDFLDDERMELLFSIVDPIANILFKERNEIGQRIRKENEDYEQRQKEKAEENRRRAEEKAHAATKAKNEAERKQKDAEKRAEMERQRSQYILDVSSAEDKNIMNSVHSIYNMSTRVKRTLDEVNNLDGFPKEGRKKLEKASVSNQRILSMSKLISKAGRVIENNDAIKTVNITEFIKEYISDVLTRFYEKSDIDISCKGDIDSVFNIKIKPLSFIMMIDNIVGNAIKAEASEMNIMLNNSNSEYSISFADNGKGIDPLVTDIEHLFDFGVSTTNGSGLGLFYAKKCMTELKGLISIEQNNDKGVSVVLRWKKNGG